MSNRPVAFTAERLLLALQALPEVDSYVVGFSGGADSTALLHALKQITAELKTKISAVHVNHGLHGDADLWQTHCQAFCQQNDIELTCLKVAIDRNSGKGLEAEARELRYTAISEMLEPGSCLLTAHHADDQAETLLLNLMRGSGVDGLSAMPGSRALGDAVLQRPLLGFQNNSLQDYLLEQQIEWIEDPSNLLLNFDRNFVRHQVIPLLEQHWPQVSKRLLLTGKAMTDARKLLEELADNYLDENLAHPLILKISALTDNQPELFKLVIRRWLKRAGGHSIGVYQLETFCQQARLADSDHRVSVSFDGGLVRLFRQRLWLHLGEEITPCPLLKWPPAGNSIELGPDLGQLLIAGNPGVIPDGTFSVGGRHNLDATVMELGAQHKSLKNLFQEADIPPWLRDCIPLCKLDGELVAMGDWCFSQNFRSWMSETGTRISWRPQNAILGYIQSQQQTAKP